MKSTLKNCYYIFKYTKYNSSPLASFDHAEFDFSCESHIEVNRMLTF